MTKRPLQRARSQSPISRMSRKKYSIVRLRIASLQVDPIILIEKPDRSGKLSGFFISLEIASKEPPVF
jgi:hypothetical protein